MRVSRYVLEKIKKVRGRYPTQDSDRSMLKINHFLISILLWELQYFGMKISAAIIHKIHDFTATRISTART